MSDDPYYNPEKFGLTTVGEISWNDELYQFDLTAVWRHEDGRLFYADDSGCSCPSPFEDVHSLDGLTACTFAELRAHLDEINADHKGAASAQIVELMGKIHD